MPTKDVAAERAGPLRCTGRALSRKAPTEPRPRLQLRRVSALRVTISFSNRLHGRQAPNGNREGPLLRDKPTKIDARHQDVGVPFVTRCMVRPCVARSFVDLVFGLASMYPASDWSGLLLRATMDISARSISLGDRPRLGQTGHQCSIAPGRPVSISSLPLADLGGERR